MIVKNVIDKGKRKTKFFFLKNFFVLLYNYRQTTNFAGILEDKRNCLPEIEASVEKCLMLNRLIDYIKEVKLIEKKNKISNIFYYLSIKE